MQGLASVSGFRPKVTLDQPGLQSRRKAGHKVYKVEGKLEPTETG